MNISKKAIDTNVASIISKLYRNMYELKNFDIKNDVNSFKIYQDLLNNTIPSNYEEQIIAATIEYIFNFKKIKEINNIELSRALNRKGLSYLSLWSRDGSSLEYNLRLMNKNFVKLVVNKNNYEMWIIYVDPKNKIENEEIPLPEEKKIENWNEEVENTLKEQDKSII